jgi:hypothetical protein
MTHQYVNVTVLGHGIHDITRDTWAHEHKGGSSLYVTHQYVNMAVLGHGIHDITRDTWAHERAGGSRSAHDTSVRERDRARTWYTRHHP